MKIYFVSLMGEIPEIPNALRIFLGRGFFLRFGSGRAFEDPLKIFSKYQISKIIQFSYGKLNYDSILVFFRDEKEYWFWFLTIQWTIKNVLSCLYFKNKKKSLGLSMPQYKPIKLKLRNRTFCFILLSFFLFKKRKKKLKS